jgi:translation initiation factor 4G
MITEAILNFIQKPDIHEKQFIDNVIVKECDEVAKIVLEGKAELVMLLVEYDPQIWSQLYFLCQEKNVPHVMYTQVRKGFMDNSNYKVNTGRMAAAIVSSSDDSSLNDLLEEANQALIKRYSIKFLESMSRRLTYTGLTEKEKIVIPNNLVKVSNSIRHTCHKYESSNESIISRTPVTTWKSVASEPTSSEYLHKTKNRYIVGRIGSIDPHEEIRSKHIKAILNKLTPDNFERLLSQLLSFKYPNETSINNLATQILEKALTEPKFSEIYAELVRRLLVDTIPENGLLSFPFYKNSSSKIFYYNIRRALTIKCHLEFKRERKKLLDVKKTMNLADLSDKARVRKLGNISFIGHLYQHGLLTRKIIIECISVLLTETQEPNLENLEVACKLITTVGRDLEYPSLSSYKSFEAFRSVKQKSKQEMKEYFKIIEKMSINFNIENRIRFMCQDLMLLRNNNWVSCRKSETPSYISKPCIKYVKSVTKLN